MWRLSPGDCSSKIMRDVEAVEGLSTQLFLSILNIALNIGVALVVTVSKSRIVFIFFLLTTPVAAITMVTFRNIMKNGILNSVRKWKRLPPESWKWWNLCL